MKHSDIITTYESHIERGNKLQAVKFVYDLMRKIEELITKKNPSKPGYHSSTYIGLRESKELVDDNIKGKDLLTNLKSKYPKHYKLLRFVKLGN